MKRTPHPASGALRNLMPVAQKDPMGCGIACVAFICGTPYNSGKRLFSIHDGTRPDCFCRDITAALAKAGKAYGWRRTSRGRTRYAEGSMVFIMRSNRFPAGHFLVRRSGMWMDPWLNLDAANPDIGKARAGFRKRLPGKASYYIFPINQD